MCGRGEKCRSALACHSERRQGAAHPRKQSWFSRSDGFGRERESASGPSEHPFCPLLLLPLLLLAEVLDLNLHRLRPRHHQRSFSPPAGLVSSIPSSTSHHLRVHSHSFACVRSGARRDATAAAAAAATTTTAESCVRRQSRETLPPAQSPPTLQESIGRAPPTRVPSPSNRATPSAASPPAACFAAVHHHTSAHQPRLLLFRSSAAPGNCHARSLFAHACHPSSRVAALFPGSPARPTLASSCTTQRRYRSTARSQTPSSHRRPPCSPPPLQRTAASPWSTLEQGASSPQLPRINLPRPWPSACLRPPSAALECSRLPSLTHPPSNI